MFGIFVAPVDETLPDTIETLNASMRDWTAKAARGECAWICCDCGMSFQDGMPDECAYKDQRCTDIIKRDKADSLTPNVELTGDPQLYRGASSEQSERG